ncbi:hypothetical protein RI367_000590 [Sorochytrium milnesiophthora]
MTSTRRVAISELTDNRERRLTFNKRKRGLMKKAFELATLCGVDIALVLFDFKGQLHQFSTTDDVDELLLRYADFDEAPVDVKTMLDYQQTHKNVVRSTVATDSDDDGHSDADVKLPAAKTAPKAKSASVKQVKRAPAPPKSRKKHKQMPSPPTAPQPAHSVPSPAADSTASITADSLFAQFPPLPDSFTVAPLETSDALQSVFSAGDNLINWCGPLTNLQSTEAASSTAGLGVADSPLMPTLTNELFVFDMLNAHMNDTSWPGNFGVPQPLGPGASVATPPVLQTFGGTHIHAVSTSTARSCPGPFLL